MALLPAVSFHLSDSQPLDTCLIESLVDLLELERLDDRSHFYSSER
jgi:hypothetical protein